MKELSQDEREIFLGLCHAAQGLIHVGQFEDARLYLRKAIQIHPFSANVWFELARILDNWDDRRVALENVLVLAPEHSGAIRLLEDLYRNKPT